MIPISPPEPLVEAARDLLVICGGLNVPSPATRVLHHSHEGTKAARIGWAYSAVSEALQLAAMVQRDPGRYGLDAVVGALVALMLRRVARDLQVETDRWDTT